MLVTSEKNFHLDLKLQLDEFLVSFDVTALFTSIPVNDEVIKELLEKDNSWKKGLAEKLSVENVVQLLSFCLNTTNIDCSFIRGMVETIVPSVEFNLTYYILTSALRALVNSRQRLNFTSGTIIFHHSLHEQSIFV